MTVESSGPRADIARAMFDHLKATLHPDLARKIDSTLMRELLLALADWVYLERSKAAETTAPEGQQALDRARQMDEAAAEKGSFLDALGQIR